MFMPQSMLSGQVVRYANSVVACWGTGVKGANVVGAAVVVVVVGAAVVVVVVVVVVVGAAVVVVAMLRRTGPGVAAVV